MSRPPTYLVTGGAGFIGSNLVAALAARGADVVVCDWLRQDARWRNLAKHEIAWLVSPEELPGWLQSDGARLDAVLHMGAITATNEPDIDLLAARNIRASLELLQWCTRAATRFVYASSAATYGDGAAGFDDEFSPEALARLQPLNAYGWSKHLVDRRIARLAKRGEALPPQWVGLKFFNVYGPNEYHKGSMMSWVAKNYQAVRDGEPVQLFRSHRADYADGGQQRDFIYVRDCVDVILWMLDHPNICGMFNLGTGRARTWLELAHALSAAVEREPVIHFVSMPADLVDPYQYFTEARLSRLRSAGYDRAFWPLEAGIRDYVQTYLSARDSYR